MSKFTKEYQPITKNTFDSNNQPTSEAKSLGKQKNKIKETLKGAMLNELAVTVIDNGIEYTKAEELAKDILQEWKNTKDPRYFKVVADIVKEVHKDDKTSDYLIVQIRPDDDKL
jgi:hypothetical protein